MKNKKRVVVKIGTAVFAENTGTAAKGSALQSVVTELATAATEQKIEFILVASGAIGAGLKILDLSKKPQEIRKKQAIAAVGQVSLMQTYQKLFAAHGLTVAQVLLTRSDFEDRQKYLNARNTLMTLLELGIVPIINENDTVAVDEIRFGDNDELSALVAAKMDANLLLVLSSVDGLLRSKEGEPKDVVSVVPEITKEIEQLAWQGVKTKLGTGGMTSKIQAAKIATASGVNMVIANAWRKNVITDLLNGKDVGTKFLSGKSLSAKQKWILFGAIPKGTLTVDDGAAQALQNLKKSLLPAGVVAVRGLFQAGDVVKIISRDGAAVAHGVAAFSSTEIEKIKGRKSNEIKNLLNQPNARMEIIHRDDLALSDSLWK